jgi:hypothetical protein
MQQAVSSRVLFPTSLDFYNLPNPSSRTMALGSTPQFPRVSSYGSPRRPAPRCRPLYCFFIVPEYLAATSSVRNSSFTATDVISTAWKYFDQILCNINGPPKSIHPSTFQRKSSPVGVILSQMNPVHNHIHSFFRFPLPPTLPSHLLA